MDDKTLQALIALAHKLGTTADHLWGVLLKQAPITGVVDLLVCAAWVSGVLAWARFVKRKTTAPASAANNRHPSADWSDDAGVGLAWFSVAFAAISTALIVGSHLSTIVAALVNPEYWALKQILK